MGTFIKVQDCKDGKLISISTPFSSRTKLLDFFYPVLFFVGAVGFGSLLLTQWRSSVGASIIAVLMIIACVVAFYRFINKATETEKLFVNQERLDIISSALLKEERKSFLLKEISDFKFLEKEKFEPHPLKGETFDYLGFQTEQQVILKHSVSIPSIVILSFFIVTFLACSQKVKNREQEKLYSKNQQYLFALLDDYKAEYSATKSQTIKDSIQNKYLDKIQSFLVNSLGRYR